MSNKCKKFNIPAFIDFVSSSSYDAGTMNSVIIKPLPACDFYIKFLVSEHSITNWGTKEELVRVVSEQHLGLADEYGTSSPLDTYGWRSKTITFKEGDAIYKILRQDLESWTEAFDNYGGGTEESAKFLAIQGEDEAENDILPHSTSRKYWELYS